MKPNDLHRWSVLVVAALYLTTLVGTITSAPFSEFPRPTLQRMLGGQWAQEVEGYLAEHLGFHDGLFRIKSQIDLAIGEKMIQGVYITDDMLLEKLMNEDVPSAERAAAPVNAFNQETGVPTYLILVPSASEVYKTTLPANAVSADQKNRIQAIYKETGSGVRCVDAYSILSSVKNNYIYYRTDTHWTSYGSFSVYQTAIQTMGYSAVPYENYVISHLSREFRGDLYRRTLYSDVKADVLDMYSNERGFQITDVTAYYRDGREEKRGKLYQEAALRTEDMYRFYCGNPCERLVIRTNVDNGRKLLLYKDDFADCMLPFLAQHFSEICVIDLEQAGSRYQTIVDPAEYSQALFLCSMQKWDKLWK